jgi:hypothetical protein
MRERTGHASNPMWGSYLVVLDRKLGNIFAEMHLVEMGREKLFKGGLIVRLRSNHGYCKCHIWTRATDALSGNPFKLFRDSQFRLSHDLRLTEAGVGSGRYCSQWPPFGPIVDALNSVDALVAKSDLAMSLLETVHSFLNAQPVRGYQVNLGLKRRARPRSITKSWDGVERRQAVLIQLATEEKQLPFSRKTWRSIRNGTVQF